jgi:hypothetical protein
METELEKRLEMIEKRIDELFTKLNSIDEDLRHAESDLKHLKNIYLNQIKIISTLIQQIQKEI